MHPPPAPPPPPEEVARVSVHAHADVMLLEQHIRTLLGCQGAHCAALQSVCYTEVKRALLLRLNGVVADDAPGLVFLPGTLLALATEGAVVRVLLARGAGVPGASGPARPLSRLREFENRLLLARPAAAKRGLLA